MRPSGLNQLRDLKARCWTLLYGLGISEFQSQTRVKVAELSKYGTPKLEPDDPDIREERFIPIDVLLDAELRAGDPMVTRLMAQLQGFDLVRSGMVMAAVPDGPVTIDSILRAQKEASDVTAVYLEARDAVGALDLADKRRLSREIAEAIVVLSALQARLGAS